MTMKTQLKYSTLLQVAEDVARQLSIKYAKEIAEGKFFLFAVMRGGASFGHLVSQRLGLPLGVVYPGAERENLFYYHPQIVTYAAQDRVFIYLEDVIAKGRTIEKVLNYHDGYLKHAREFIPVVMDASVDSNVKAAVNIVGIVSSDWIVFPYESMDHVVEGDRGLFRDGTSQNNQTQV